MRLFINASKDTTLYQRFPTNNAGLDEILEIGKVIDSGDFDTVYTGSAARALVQFSLPTPASVPANATYYLNLRIASAEKLSRPQTLEIIPISRSWDEGTGYFYQDIVNENNGATWRQYNTLTSWSSAGGDLLTGGTTQSIELTEYPLEDIRVNVTTILQPLVNSGSSYNGLAIRFPADDETNRYNKGVVKVFSSQTHTIHQPTLEVAWDAASYATGTLAPLPASSYVVACKNLKEEYSNQDIVRIDLIARDKFPNRSFDSVLRYRNRYYLPTSSYYSIEDVQSNTVVVPFDNYSKLDGDASGPYFTLDTRPLYKGRFYTVKFKIDSGSRSTVFPSNNIFKIV